MSLNYNKRYSFRLTKEYKEVYDFLESVPNNEKSEVIRQMLRLAYKTITENREFHKQLESLKREVNDLKALQKTNHGEILDELKKLEVKSKAEHVEEDEPVDDSVNETISESASEMLSAFGIEF